MTPAEAKALAQSSGNHFQSRVTNYFREHDWALLISPYYVDASTDRPRESDLIAEKSFPIVQPIGPHPRSVRVRLFIECKYITAGAIFWMGQRDNGRAGLLVREKASLLPPGSAEYNAHHYVAEAQVAKLFASKGGQQENDPIFKGLNQCVNNVIYNAVRDTLVPTVQNERTITLDYPVLMCSDFGEFYGTDMIRMNDPEAMTQPFFQLEMNYAYPRAGTGRTIEQYFLIDVVNFERIAEFLAALDREVNGVKRLWHQR